MIGVSELESIMRPGKHSRYAQCIIEKGVVFG